MQSKNPLTAEPIGNEIGLSHRRRPSPKRFRENAVITDEVAMIPAAALDNLVCVNVFLLDLTRRCGCPQPLHPGAAIDPLVISADSLLGEADFTFTVVARDKEPFAKPSDVTGRPS